MSRVASRKPTIIASVHKALTIMDLFGEERKPLGVTEISRALGMNFSTTHHLISTLALGGYLEQDPATRKYYLGIRCVEIGLAAEESHDLIDRARPILRELASRVNENVNLAVYHRAEAVYIDQASGTRTIAMFARLGARVPLHCTGVGKAYLASLEPEQAHALIDQEGWHKFTNNTITEWYMMERELEDIREVGYAVDREEREVGVACLAVPVMDASGCVVAGVSVSGPSGRILTRLPDLIPEAIHAAKRVSQYTARLAGRL